ncbi:MAG: hypothetical protein FWG02_04865 [Holophagaceae bacterium]|nr:hypothetical protein [Holophagaceae bacterium]
MSSRPANHLRLLLIILFSLLLMYFLAPWPAPQAVVHVFIVLGLAPELRNSLYCGLLAASAGWLLESALRTYPVMGGTAMGNMVCALLLWYSLSISPPEKPFSYYTQLVLAVIIHTIVVRFFVNIASGPHVLGYGWQWSLVLLPAWGALTWRFYSPPHMR